MNNCSKAIVVVITESTYVANYMAYSTLQILEGSRCLTITESSDLKYTKEQIYRKDKSVRIQLKMPNPQHLIYVHLK